ncbi:heat shock factor protein 5 isoform X2 [Xenopus laevis]|uniref:Heat shock factor protein 5 n=1 Tax=Xenopus laevis TaxID=8355 RepID=A0A8J1M7M1_XENLA|nr:heat shock factor protein 5 isoform X2 [Xenopus laevis]
MEGEQPKPTVELNFNSFVVKLWRIVNSPHYQSIFWDYAGRNVVVAKQMFVSEVLCPEIPHREETDPFKTKNFESFIRQLNLYGFRKVQKSDGKPCYPEEEGGVHVFHNPNFQKEHPEFLVNIKRLTSSNKAKIAAGLEVKSRPKIRLNLLCTCAVGEHKNLYSQGPETAEPKHHALQHENPSSNPSFSPPFKQIDETSVSQTTGSMYMGLLPVQNLSAMAGPEQESSAFISPRAPYQPVLCSTGAIPGPEMDEPKSQILLLENTTTNPSYSPPSSSNINFPTTRDHCLGLLPVQGLSTIAEQEYSTFISPSAPYPPVLCPTAYLQCCTYPAHLHPLIGCASSAATTSLPYGYFQTPPRQSPNSMNILSPKRSDQDSNDSTEDENPLMQSSIPVDFLSSKKLELDPVDCKKTETSTS